MTPCQSLDDYLAHDLTGEAFTRFTAHLSDCPACDRTIREQQRLADLLTEATTRLEPVPAGLAPRVERRLRTARRRRFVAAAAALAAAVLAVGLLGRMTARRGEPELPQTARTEPPAPEPPRPADWVRVTFPVGANVLAVPVTTESPNVTAIWVYPGLRTASRPAPVAGGPPPSPERSDS
jgi:hypothetical protein